MQSNRMIAAYLAAFRFVPLLIIALMAVLWRFVGEKTAVVTGVALFFADAILLATLAFRQGKGGRHGQGKR